MVTRSRPDRSLSFGSAAAAYERGRPSYPPGADGSREGIGDILAHLQLGFDAARKYESPATASGDPRALAAL